MLVQDKILIHEWVCKALEGTISQAESDRLQEALAADPDALGYYQTCIQVNMGLVKIQPILDDSLAMNSCLQEMAEYEKQAEVLDIKDICPKPEWTPIKMAPVAAQTRPTNKMLLYAAIVSTAALFLMMLYVYHNPRAVRQEVATLADSLNAEWADSDNGFRSGSRLRTGQGPATLSRGMVKLLYDDGVEVVIEAPAEFELLTSMEIALRSGRLYATVSEAGKGFTVRTQNARIIDLGTEFGVDVNTGGDTSLHVFKGKTTLIAGFQRKEKEIAEVTAEQARRVDTFNADIKAIEFDKKTFARSFDSRTQSVWRGESVAALSDALAGTLNPRRTDAPFGTAGGPAAETVWVGADKPVVGPGIFLPMPENPFISGLFVPNGADGPIPVSADGRVHWDAPAAPLRQRIGVLRFDIRSYAGDRRGAALGLYLRELVGTRPVAVYGLIDETADAWSEADLNYANAPGFRPALLGRYDLDAAVLRRLGTIAFSQLGPNHSAPELLPLDAFIGGDTNGLLTFVLVCEESHPSAEWRFVTKEGDPSQSPSLVFSSGADAVTIRTADGNGADTYLTNDNQYSVVNSEDTHGGETSFRVRNYWKDAILATNAGVVELDEAGQKQTCAFMLEGRPVGTPDNPVVALRANAGITFDLRQMQRQSPENRPARSFSTVCGVPENIAEYAAAYRADYVPGVNVYVLVDGVVRFSHRGLNARREPITIHLTLEPADRWLTLAITGGADQKSPYDWCLFVRPQILFE